MNITRHAQVIVKSDKKDQNEMGNIRKCNVCSFCGVILDSSVCNVWLDISAVCRHTCSGEIKVSTRRAPMAC
jgi:hypothetical protein